MRSHSVNRLTRIISKCIIFLFLSATLMLFSGCDGYINVKGIAYEWVNAPAGAESRIYTADVDFRDEMEAALQDIIAKIPADIEKAPLGGVKIGIGEKEKIGIIGDEAYFRAVTTNASGEFDSSWVVAPGKYGLFVRATKAGYRDVTGETPHEGVSRNIIVAILVKEKD